MPWFDVNWRGFNNTILGRELYPIYQYFLNNFNKLVENTSHPVFKTGIENLSIVSYSNQFINRNLETIDTMSSITNDLTSNSFIQLIFNCVLNFSEVNFLSQIVSFNKFIFIILLFFISIMKILFLFLFFLMLFLKLINNYASVLEFNRSIFAMMYESFVLFWINLAYIKFESYEEALCSIILWPWCIFLVLTHLVTLENNEIFFIFIEWGLPVMYGYMLIIEHIWLFGSHFLIYLNGARGRRSLIITIIEDIISFFILIARVSLQMIRGIICGFYHDFFREITEYIVDSWETYAILSTWDMPFYSSRPFNNFLFFFINWYLIALTLLFIYLILFLQLLFLLIAVWLFARCWFMSKKKQPYNYDNYFDNLYKHFQRERNIEHIYALKYNYIM